jgi:nucleotide-binding universal stress UspA family protein
MKMILCPTDFSKCADNAVDFAVNMAIKMPATLILVHGLHVPLVDAYAPASTLATMMEEAETLASKRMDNLCEEISAKFSLEVESEIAFGLVTDLISKLERRKQVDLIVLGTSGTSNAIDVLLGTTASQIVAKAHSPTLVVPTEAKFENFDQVGYATDFTDDSDGKIEVFTEIMKPFKSIIEVVHVANEKEINGNMDNILKHLDTTSYPQMIKGEDITEELNTFIGDKNLKMLAMKRHRYNWFDKLFHKSITKQMVYHSEIPIMIFS